MSDLPETVVRIGANNQLFVQILRLNSYLCWVFCWIQSLVRLITSIKLRFHISAPHLSLSRLTCSLLGVFWSQKTVCLAATLGESTQMARRRPRGEAEGGRGRGDGAIWGHSATPYPQSSLLHHGATATQRGCRNHCAAFPHSSAVCFPRLNVSWWILILVQFYYGMLRL